MEKTKRSVGPGENGRVGNLTSINFSDRVCVTLIQCDTMTHCSDRLHPGNKGLRVLPSRDWPILGP